MTYIHTSYPIFWQMGHFVPPPPRGVIRKHLKESLALFRWLRVAKFLKRGRTPEGLCALGRELWNGVGPLKSCLYSTQNGIRPLRMLKEWVKCKWLCFKFFVLPATWLDCVSQQSNTQTKQHKQSLNHSHFDVNYKVEYICTTCSSRKQTPDLVRVHSWRGYMRINVNFWLLLLICGEMLLHSTARNYIGFRTAGDASRTLNVGAMRQ